MKAARELLHFIGVSRTQQATQKDDFTRFKSEYLALPLEKRSEFLAQSHARLHALAKDLHSYQLLLEFFDEPQLACLMDGHWQHAFNNPGAFIDFFAIDEDAKVQVHSEKEKFIINHCYPHLIEKIDFGNDWIAVMTFLDERQKNHFYQLSKGKVSHWLIHQKEHSDKTFTLSFGLNKLPSDCIDDFLLQATPLLNGLISDFRSLHECLFLLQDERKPILLPLIIEHCQKVRNAQEFIDLLLDTHHYPILQLADCVPRLLAHSSPHHESEKLLEKLMAHDYPKQAFRELLINYAEKFVFNSIEKIKSTFNYCELDGELILALFKAVHHLLFPKQGMFLPLFKSHGKVPHDASLEFVVDKIDNAEEDDPYFIVAKQLQWIDLYGAFQDSAPPCILAQRDALPAFD